MSRRSPKIYLDECTGAVGRLYIERGMYTYQKTAFMTEPWWPWSRIYAVVKIAALPPGNLARMHVFPPILDSNGSLYPVVWWHQGWAEFLGNRFHVIDNVGMRSFHVGTHLHCWVSSAAILSETCPWISTVFDENFPVVILVCWVPQVPSQTCMTCRLPVTALSAYNSKHAQHFSTFESLSEHRHMVASNHLAYMPDCIYIYLLETSNCAELLIKSPMIRWVWWSRQCRHTYPRSGQNLPCWRHQQAHDCSTWAGAIRRLLRSNLISTQNPSSPGRFFFSSTTMTRHMYVSCT